VGRPMNIEIYTRFLLMAVVMLTAGIWIGQNL
jgi:hypothetical protein